MAHPGELIEHSAPVLRRVERPGLRILHLFPEPFFKAARHIYEVPATRPTTSVRTVFNAVRLEESR